MRRAADRRVGRYFERLIAYWLRYVRRLDVISIGEVIRAAGRTLGELDILFRDESGRVNHWEVAVKFYLFVESEMQPSRRYLGPNPLDRMDKKVAKLFDHQLRLGREHHPEVQVQQALMKGRVFYPVPFIEPTTFEGERPKFLAENHLRGRWLRASRLSEALPQESYYRILQKPFWLAPEYSQQRPDGLYHFKDMLHILSKHFAGHGGRPRLLAQMTYRDGIWLEMERYFVVSELWPHG